MLESHIIILGSWFLKPFPLPFPLVQSLKYMRLFIWKIFYTKKKKKEITKSIYPPCHWVKKYQPIKCIEKD